MAGNVTPINGPRKPRKPRKPKAPPEPTAIVPVADAGAAEHQMRLEGKTWAQIAKALKHPSPATAQLARQRYLQRAGLALAAEKRAEALALEIERLDTLQASYWDAAVTGYRDPEFPGLPSRPDVKAAEVILKIIAMRAKMLGLEEADRTAQGPRTVVVTGNSDQYVATLKALIANEGEIVEADVVDDDDA